MKYHPILFNGEMVRAILDGKKTQTRRVVKPQPVGRPYRYDGCGTVDINDYGDVVNDDHEVHYLEKLTLIGDYAEDYIDIGRCPYGVPGDRLWVRETFAIVPRTAYARSGVRQTLRTDDNHDAAVYRAGWEHSTGGIPWRLALDVISVRAERVQDISIEDAIAEGIEDVESAWAGMGDALGLGPRKFVTAFGNLWDSINAKWVWVVEFQPA